MTLRHASLFRAFKATDTDACLALFDQNCPAFFTPDERADYSTYLGANPPGYEVCVQGEQIAAAYGLCREAGHSGRINWVLASPEWRGSGLGAAMMERAIDRARRDQLSAINIAASHLSAPFFARFGARVTGISADGWGPGMHRHDMLLTLA